MHALLDVPVLWNLRALDVLATENNIFLGVSDNRLQNVVFTLDKLKLCLGQPGENSHIPAGFFRKSRLAEVDICYMLVESQNNLMSIWQSQYDFT